MELQHALNIGVPKDAIAGIRSFCANDKEYTGIKWATNDAEKKLKSVEIISAHFVDQGMFSFHPDDIPAEEVEAYDAWLIFGKKKPEGIK